MGVHGETPFTGVTAGGNPRNSKIYKKFYTSLQKSSLQKLTVPLGRGGDAAFIFILNTLFGYFFADAVKNQNLFTTVFWGVVGSSWYFANIYGSVRDTKKHNVNTLYRFVYGLKERYLKLNFCEVNIISEKIFH